MRFVSGLVVGFASLSLVVGCSTSATHLAEGIGPAVTDTTTLPDPTTTIPAPTTTNPPVATAAQSTFVRVCPASVPPAAASTLLATPVSPDLPYSATPGGPPVGVVANPWGGLTSRPVVNQQSDWVQIRLYSRPNGSVGWVPVTEVVLSTTDIRIVVSICRRTLTVFQGGAAVYSSPVGVGQPQWPTPIGPSFVDAVVATPRNELSIYGPTVVMLGTHSNVFTDFAGGDGVVAIHGYPSDPRSTLGVASSHGCIRSSPATVNAVKVVPIGTPVDLIY